MIDRHRFVAGIDFSGLPMPNLLRADENQVPPKAKLVKPADAKSV